jgi:hypothetical protein
MWESAEQPRFIRQPGHPPLVDPMAFRHPVTRILALLLKVGCRLVPAFHLLLREYLTVVFLSLLSFGLLSPPVHPKNLSPR